jgi:hypothetical protein
MQPTATYPQQQARFSQLPGLVVKFIALASLLVYAFTHMSTGHLVLALLVCGLALALLNRIEHIIANDEDHHKRAADSVSFDGGTYNRKQQVTPEQTTSPAMSDGGSFRRSSLTLKTGM